MRDYRKRGDRVAAEKIGGMDRHATMEGRIDMSVTRLARLIGRRMAREMFEADEADDRTAAPLTGRKRSGGP
ncbi:hypothetical protein Snov_0775 [Ancylobacter novellus DSM 506]|jgi:hypothetical protein|uniref:Uncharacterized protein n=1 Tax=Ancylobacter novellus (strain ATCC 8093 / DSM 506 / JCM 20403 / CCM 1077 / IAM 12100 / NBRC 12443 / NCIMB 10456) TaxID=639283 RepID=D7A5I2_ANCN5|nr:hypothetical protein [Ancylobacter novellus]ADH88106.1 hypothetical protein Snov_0775 [Ancylobacter novellus DSM 506]MDF2813010.1 hypothetical protein [Microvirga sp.]